MTPQLVEMIPVARPVLGELEIEAIRLQAGRVGDDHELAQVRHRSLREAGDHGVTGF